MLVLLATDHLLRKEEDKNTRGRKLALDKAIAVTYRLLTYLSNSLVILIHLSIDQHFN